VQDSAQSNGNAAFLLTSVEIGLGSVIHSLHLPLGGHFLSLNQGLILLWSTEKRARWDAFESANVISTASALLKSLSPAGKKLTPMLAISMQGFLYSLGIFLGGNGKVGKVLGMVLLSTWGLLQPILLTAFLFGMDFFESIEKTTGKLLPWLLGALLLKAVIAVLIAVAGFSVSEPLKAKYLNWIQERKSETRLKRRVSLLIGVSLLINLGFFVMSGKFDALGVWTYLLRPLAIFWLLIYVSRNIPEALRRAVLKKFPKTAQALEFALARSRHSKS
jgi:hypothetical protein